MRDMLNDLDAQKYLSDPDPIRRAQSQMKTQLPKRFYKNVAVTAADNGFVVHLDGKPVRVLFSGDTVVDEASWGQQSLAFGFIRHAAQTQAQSPDPLYWLLISKGHRTYRYLSAFSIDYAPSPAQETPPEQQRLMDFLAHDRFGAAYDASRGVVRFDESHGHLRADLAAVPAIHAHLPEVAFFLERNPGYRRGEELVCLCPITADTLLPLARRAFLAARREARAAAADLRVAQS